MGGLYIKVTSSALTIFFLSNIYFCLVFWVNFNFISLQSIFSVVAFNLKADHILKYYIFITHLNKFVQLLLVVRRKKKTFTARKHKLADQ